MHQTQVLKMALSLIQSQRLNIPKDQISIVLLDSYVYRSKFTKEEILKFLRNEKLGNEKKSKIALGIVHFQIGRRGLANKDSSQWEYYASFFCKFNQKDCFLGIYKQEWVRFFTIVSKTR